MTCSAGAPRSPENAQATSGRGTRAFGWLVLCVFFGTGCALDRSPRAVDGPVAPGMDAAVPVDAVVVRDAGSRDGGPGDAGMRDAGTCETVELTEVAASDFELLDNGLARESQALWLARDEYEYGSLEAHAHPVLLNAEHDIELVQTSDAYGGGPVESLDVDEMPTHWGINGIDHTVIAEGEIYLDGEITLEPEAGVDRKVVLELEFPGETIRMVGTGDELSRGITPPEPGWYPIRIATEARYFGGVTHRLTTRPALEPQQLRHRRDHRCVVQRGYEQRLPQQTPARVRFDCGPLDRYYSYGGISELDLRDRNRWSQYWTGRLLFRNRDAVIRVVSDDHHFVFVDGHFVGGVGSPGIFDREYALQIEPGYHDVVLVHVEEDGLAQMTLSIDGEVVNFGEAHSTTRFHGMPFAHAAVPEEEVPAGEIRTSSLVLDSPTDAAAAVEVSLLLQTERPEDVNFRIFAPTEGTPAYDGPFTAESWELVPGWHVARTTLVRPAQTNGTWRVEVANGSPDRLRLAAFGVIAHIHGTAEPFRTRGFADSMPRRSDEVLVGARPTVRSVEGGAVALQLRTAPTVEALEDMAWSPVGPDGMMATPLEPGFFQVRAELTGPGHVTPRLSRVVLLSQRCR